MRHILCTFFNLLGLGVLAGMFRDSEALNWDNGSVTTVDLGVGWTTVDMVS